MDFLEYTVAAHPAIDLGRWLLAAFGVFVFAVSLVRWLQHDYFWLPIAGMAIGLMTALQEYEVIGEPLRPWRLSLLGIASVAITVHLYRLGADGSGRDGPRSTP